MSRRVEEENRDYYNLSVMLSCLSKPKEFLSEGASENAKIFPLLP